MTSPTATAGAAGTGRPVPAAAPPQRGTAEPPAHSEDGTAHDLTHALHCAAKALLARAVDTRSLGLPFALDRAATFVLGRLRALGVVRLSDLAADLDLDASTVSRHVAALESRGLLTRTPDPDDARARQVALTPLGASVVEAVLDERRSRLADATRAWSDADRRRLASLLARLADDLRGGPDHTPTPTREHP